MTHHQWAACMEIAADKVHAWVPLSQQNGRVRNQFVYSGADVLLNEDRVDAAVWSYVLIGSLYGAWKGSVS